MYTVYIYCPVYLFPSEYKIIFVIQNPNSCGDLQHIKIMVLRKHPMLQNNKDVAVQTKYFFFVHTSDEEAKYSFFVRTQDNNKHFSPKCRIDGQ